jgi:hypothetical protein
MNIKKLILEAAQEIEQEIADGTLKIGEAVEIKDKGASGISKEYGGGLMISGVVDGQKRLARLKKDEVKTWSTMTPQQKEDLYKDYLITNFDPKAQAGLFAKIKEAIVVIPTSTGDTPTDPIKKKEAIDATKKGDTVKFVKKGLPITEEGTPEEYEVINTKTGKVVAGPFKDIKRARAARDKKDTEYGAVSHRVAIKDTVIKEAADEPTDAEQEEPAEEQGGISDKLSSLISQAIDAAGQVISSTEDTKMETALGKVVKNLTSAQDALTKVSEHEGKLAEKAEAETAKNLEKYTKDFLKGLRKYTKDDALIAKFRRTYDPLVAAAMKAEKPVDEIVKTSWGHFTMNESKK